ncbi:MAG: SRPBCC family protein, partial [Nocardioidaceae bacterium]
SDTASGTPGAQSGPAPASEEAPPPAAALDLGATVLPVLVKRYAPYAVGALLVVLVLRKLRKLRRR